MEKIFNVLLDTKDDVKNPAFVVNTNDLQTVKINLLINQDGDPLDLTGATVRLAVKKPDKTTVLQDITVVDALSGSCEIVLNTQAYVIDGKYDAEVMVYYGVDTVAVTGQFSYRAVKGILDDGTVESTNEWQSINQAIADAESIKTDAQASADASAASAVTAQTLIDGAKGTYPTLSDRLTADETSLADSANYVLKATDFNIKTSNADNHDNIISALDKLKLNGGGTLLLPFGTVKTSPIDFTGYHNIVIKGVGRSYAGSVNTTVKIIGTNPAGSVGLKFADTTNPYPDSYNSWGSKFCKLEGIFLECDNKCDVGINGNRGLELTDVTVRRARVDGIVLEDFTYPVYLRQVESSYNGRHGLYARGKMSTVYTGSNCEFTGNGGYGLYLEGGAAPSFTNVLLQSNVIGGLKINKISGYTGNYFLSELTFINLYTEANGTLLSSDPNYEGNCGIYITGYDKTNASTGKPTNVKFIGGKINAISGGTSVKIDSVWGCKFDTQISGNVDIASTGVYGVQFATSPSSSMVPTGTLGSSLTSYHTLTGVQGIMYNGGIFPSRGRTLILEFYLPTISAGTTVNMNSLYQTMASMTMAKGYSMIKNGSIIGLRLVKKGVGSAGTITCKPVYYAGPVLYVDPPNTFSGGFTNLVLNCATDNKVSGFYNPDLYKFSADNIVGIQLISSADYVAGTYDGFIAQLMIEI